VATPWTLDSAGGSRKRTTSASGFFIVESPKGADAVLIECRGVNALPSGERIFRHDDLALPEGLGRGELLLLVHKVGTPANHTFSIMTGSPRFANMVHQNPVCHCISHDPYSFEPIDPEADRKLKALETGRRGSKVAGGYPEKEGGEAPGPPSLKPKRCG
jgi:hypothetical protein